MKVVSNYQSLLVILIIYYNLNIIDKVLPEGNPEVFNVSENDYTFYDAEPLCRALGAELATYDQVKEAWSKGADWCNYGWVKGQAAVYPIQEETYNKIQSGPDEEKNSCGSVGLNGGYFENPELKFGVNCYGVKPPQSENDQELLMKQGKIPRSVAALKIDQPYTVGRWIGGTLTNFEEITKRVKRLESLLEQKQKGLLAKYTKKERLMIDREIIDLEERFGGIANMKFKPKAMFVILFCDVCDSKFLSTPGPPNAPPPNISPALS
jgi:hypothetical protein